MIRPIDGARYYLYRWYRKLFRGLHYPLSVRGCIYRAETEDQVYTLLHGALDSHLEANLETRRKWLKAAGERISFLSKSEE